MTVAVVTAVAGRRGHLARQRAGLVAGTRRPDRHVVVAMDDQDVEPGGVEVVRVASSAGRWPVAAARNVGAAAAIAGGADVVVFLDVDVVPGPETIARYAAAVAAHPGQLLSGPVAYLPAGVTDPAAFAGHPFHPARPVPDPGQVVEMTDPDLFWSLSFATSAAAWDSVGGFDEGYTGYGGEDTDLGLRALAAGVGLAWLGGAVGYHQHHPVSDPPVEHVDDILRNGARFAARWGRWPMVGWLDAFERRGLVRRTADGWARSGWSPGPQTTS